MSMEETLTNENKLILEYIFGMVNTVLLYLKIKRVNKNGYKPVSECQGIFRLLPTPAEV